jgi:hypothetical protein
MVGASHAFRRRPTTLRRSYRRGHTRSHLAGWRRPCLAGLRAGGAGGAYIAHFAMCAKRRCCHPECSEGSRQLLRELPGFFAALRMTPERVATAWCLCLPAQARRGGQAGRGPFPVRPLTHPRQQNRAVATNSLCRSKQPRKAASPEDGTYPTC